MNYMAASPLPLHPCFYRECRLISLFLMSMFTNLAVIKNGYLLVTILQKTLTLFL